MYIYMYFPLTENGEDSGIREGHVRVMLYLYINVCIPLTENGEDSGIGEGHVRVMHVQHQEGPVDGNLYARVSKPASRTTSTSDSHHQEQHQHHVTSSSQYHHQEGSHHHQDRHQRPLANGGSLVPTDISFDSGISQTSGRQVPR